MRVHIYLKPEVGEDLKRWAFEDSTLENRVTLSSMAAAELEKYHEKRKAKEKGGVKSKRKAKEKGGVKSKRKGK